MVGKISLFDRRSERVRRHIKKYSKRLRLSVYRSNNHIYAQIIDDIKQSTLVAASTLDKEFKDLKGKGTLGAAKEVGALLAKRAKEAKILEVVFDRGGYVFHGRIKALADAARENGLSF